MKIDRPIMPIYPRLCVDSVLEHLKIMGLTEASVAQIETPNTIEMTFRGSFLGGPISVERAIEKGGLFCYVGTEDKKRSTALDMLQKMQAYLEMIELEYKLNRKNNGQKD